LGVSKLDNTTNHP